MSRILHVDASARGAGSLSREIGAELVRRLAGEGGAEVVHRDVAAEPVPFVDADWVAANFTREADRTADQQATLAGSDALVDELLATDVLVLATPMYNFSLPAALKAWVDQIARVGRTFRYTSDGPVGLSGVERAYVVVATGGTGIGSEIDHLTPYLRRILAFVGIDDVEFVAAEKGDRDGAQARLDELVGDRGAA
jgi:FMN-dependent NADH-azoreductase